MICKYQQLKLLKILSVCALYIIIYGKELKICLTNIKCLQYASNVLSALNI